MMAIPGRSRRRGTPNRLRAFPVCHDGADDAIVMVAVGSVGGQREFRPTRFGYLAPLEG